MKTMEAYSNVRHFGVGGQYVEIIIKVTGTMAQPTGQAITNGIDHLLDNVRVGQTSVEVVRE